MTNTNIEQDKTVEAKAKLKKSMISMDAESVKRIDAIMNKKRCVNRPETIRYLLTRYDEDEELTKGLEI